MQPRGQFDTDIDAGRDDTASQIAAPGRPRYFRAGSLAARGLGAVLLVAFAVLMASPLQAQSASTLVSNTGQTHSTSTGYTVGASGASQYTQAQQFTTGDYADGYQLSSVQVYFKDFDASDVPSVSIFEADAFGNPDSSAYTLTNPATVTNNSLNTFTAPANAILDTETKYFVMVAATSGSFSVGVTNSNGEDSGIASAWSINDQRHVRSSDSGSWSTSSAGDSNMRVSVHGSGVLPVVTIVADSTSAIYAEGSANFTLTRTGTLDAPLAVTVDLTQSHSYLATLERTVVFLPSSATVALRIQGSDFQRLASGTVPVNGTLTATVADGTGHDVGTTSSATVNIVIAATIKIEESSYTISEEGGSVLTVTAIARTGEGAPQPTADIFVSLGTFATGSAAPPDDYETVSAILRFRTSDFTLVDTAYEARVSIEISIHDDLEYDSGETFEVRLEGAPGLHIKYWYNFVNSAGQRCGSACAVTATITDNDTAQVMGVTVAPGPRQLEVNWTAVGNATGYKVQWTSGGESYNTSDRQATVTSGSTTNYTIGSLVNGTEYTVRVIATQTGANDSLPSEEATGTPVEIALCGARLLATQRVTEQAELNICWNVGSAFGTGNSTVIEWQQRFFWGAHDTNPWGPWKEVARGDTYTPCVSGGTSCVQHTLRELLRGTPVTYRMRIRDGNRTAFESPEVEVQAPNSNATGLVPEISGSFLPGTLEFVDVPTGQFWFDLAFEDSDHMMSVLMTETVQGLDAGDLVVTNATATLELFDYVYKVTLTPVTLGQPVTAHLPANRVRGVGEGVTSGGNNYTRDNVASNTMTWQTAPPAILRATGSPGEPLTAAFENVPSSHDGSSGFTFWMTFSENVKITSADMRDHALLVNGGTVTSAEPVDGLKSRWELTVQPSGTGPVSILARLHQACTVAGALCTADGRTLTVAPALQVPGPPPANVKAVAPAVTPAFTASFTSVPEAHKGSGRFNVRIAFSEDVSISYKDMRDHVLTVSGGKVVRAKRVNKRKDLWQIRVRPSSHGAVTLTLPETASCDDPGAVCTAERLALSGTISITIAGPPVLPVADAKVQKGPNASPP